MTLASQPAGASLTYAGRAVTAPFTAQSAIGFATTISAGDQFQSGGRLWSFDHWSDNGAQLHDITIPASAFTLTAVYKDAGPAADPALVAAYAFDEASGATVTDASGRANTGTITGATRMAGHSGSSLSFNGTSNSVSVPDSSSLDLTSAMTLEAWVNPTIVSDWRTVILKEATGDLAYSLYGASGYAGVRAVDVDRQHRPPGHGGPAGRRVVAPRDDLGRNDLEAVRRRGPEGVQDLCRTHPVSSGPLKIGGNASGASGSAEGSTTSGSITAGSRPRRSHVTATHRWVARLRRRRPDTTPPTVSVTAPAAGATVSGASVAVNATAADNVGVTGVQFRLDGTTNIGAHDTTSPYGVTWDTTTLTNGTHSLTAVARDAAGNTTTSAAVAVTVSNGPPPPPASGSVAAYGFEEPSGATVTDRSGTGNTGTITGATRITTGSFGSALSFNGSSNFVSIPDSASLHLTTGMTLEAWVYQAADTD